ncbi:hypothetical protein FRX31_009606 [Thalictrum thalictroides]|uniref:DUF4283 domain-containing protein n=1 Tax=Thalictrum thalictroides TaxID=46969 RepID=A0A7J6WV71_THATH|nr:hypothetical protein FRX31_009606 [Thalictrum thalictroides]
MRVQIPVVMLRQNGSQWNHTLIFSLLDGGHLNPNHVMRTVKMKWKITEVCDMVRAGNNMFIYRFSNINDQECIEEQQPWVVMGCLILIETYSTGMVAANITFERLPLWLSFKGLKLEHLNSDTVRLIGQAVGNVTFVLLMGVIPRSAEGFRAHVQVNVNEPLVQGQFANGNVWVAFKYNNLPDLYCNLCRRLCHDKHHCTFPDASIQSQIHQERAQPALNVLSTESPANRQLILWPYDFQTAQSQAATQENRQNASCLPDNFQGFTCMGLDTIEYISSQKANFSKSKVQDTTYSPNVGPSQLNLGNLNPNDKEETSSIPRKRKIAPAEFSSSAIPYIPDPPPLFTPRENTTPIHPSTNLDNLDVLSQMYANLASPIFSYNRVLSTLASSTDLQLISLTHSST